MKKRNDKTNGIKTGNKQKGKYCFDGNYVREQRNGPLAIMRKMAVTGRE
jgi:hypothetical protein